MLLCVSDSAHTGKGGVCDPEGKQSHLLQPWSQTICSHAMLTNDHKVMIVRDLKDDWRFASNPHYHTRDGGPLRFYACAPLLVAAPGSPDGAKVEIGRLAIVDLQPRPDFGEEDAQLLAEIAAMACEALESEHRERLAQRSNMMQEAITRLADHVWKTPYSALQDLSSTTAPHKQICQVGVDAISEVMPASAAIIDVTAYRVSALRTEGSSSRGSSMTPGTPGRGASVSKGSRPALTGGLSRASSIRSPNSAYPQAPWLDAASPRSSISQLSGFASTPSAASSASSPALWTTPRSNKSSPTHSRSGSRNTALPPFEGAADEYIAQIDPASRLDIFAQSGCLPPPRVTGAEARQDIGDVLIETRRTLERGAGTIVNTLCGPFLTMNRFASSSDNTPSEGNVSADDSQSRMSGFRSPLASLFDGQDETAMYLVLPICQDSTPPQVTFLLVVSFADIVPIDEPEVTFLNHLARIIIGSLIRQKGYLAEHRQLEFVRSLQHELFTPLYGVLGASELLLTSLSNGGKELDTSPDGALARVLETIRLSAGNLSSILDDVLDFGELSGVRSAKSLSRLDVVSLGTLVEEVGQEEVEIAALGLRHAAGLSGDSIVARPPDFIISVHPSLSGLFKADRVAMRKIFRKLLHNCFRFTRRSTANAGLVEIVVRPITCSEPATMQNHETEIPVAFDFIDTGCGMTKKFIEDEYFVPFVKGDSFQQGTGLGGAIAAGLSRQLAGTFDVVSEPDEGTKVTVTLPLLRCNASAKAEQGDDSPASFAQSLHQCKVSRAFLMPFTGSAGHPKTRSLIEQHLVRRGIEIVEDPAAGHIDLLVVPETTLVCPDGACKTHLPHLPGSRVVVVCADPTQRSVNFPALKSLPFHLFRSPFGQAAFASLDSFLAESHPVALRTPPASSHQLPLDTSPAPSVPERPETVPAPAATVPGPVLAGSKAHNRHATSTSGRALTGKAGKPAPTPVAGGFKVLAVEDNPTNLRILTFVLERAGLEYYTAVDGGQAIEQFKKHQPHLVLLDISLPIQDGFACCQQMRQIEVGWSHRPRIFAVTALSSKEDQERGREVGCDAWYHKPISPRILTGLLKGTQAEWKAEQKEASQLGSQDGTAEAVVQG
ncbi:hypothetical protein BCV69DRAFT_96929 [Microstroma glucosiphilum]|uniref:histidine kinase n=1 Tax=Pseudomicrostroma glucosiphilum TaxID=1684307 RepID=A0A316UC92_9BASI|nr:hypothetical protein BCV69DRAFT_96929 [Pseudomicrostroma glucosiphilum]PWN22772.1 hypothetical protein BCV69DRAFT_96929 [Pseudomicrostroma glucosiphilum]